MFRNLPSSLSTLVLFLSNPFWALAIDAIHFTNPDWTGIAAGTPFEVAWLGGDTSVSHSPLLPGTSYTWSTRTRNHVSGRKYEKKKAE